MLTGSVARLVVCLLALCSLAWAQSAGGVTATSPLRTALPTLQSLDQSVQSQDYTATQVRRFRSAQGKVVSIREKLEVDSNGTSDPLFLLTFLSVEGEPLGSSATIEWQQVYSRFAAQLHRHGSFHILDLTAAAANYTVHDFGPVVRAGRSARRLVVFPVSVDKAIWVVDVDTQTQVTLYSAEFDTHLSLMAEVEALTFSNTVAPLASVPRIAQRLPDFAAAVVAMGSPGELVDPDVSVASGYRIGRIEVQSDPINGQWKMTMTYTDGIDQFLVVQNPGTQDLFAGLPGHGQGGNVIGRFRDPAMSVLLFWEGGVSFHIAGRGSLKRLDELAQRVYLQALSTH